MDEKDEKDEPDKKDEQDDININNINNDFFEEEEEEIRPPDAVQKMRLVGEEQEQEQVLTEDQLISQAILNSIQDWKVMQKQHDDHEDSLLQQFKETRLEREHMFKDLIITLKKVAKYDKKVAEVLGLVENIVEGYCLAYMEHCELDKETIDTIFNELSQLRVNKKAVELLREIIREEEEG